jgi:uncharacterized protein
MYSCRGQTIPKVFSMEQTPTPIRRQHRMRLFRVFGVVFASWGCVLILLMMLERTLLYPMPDVSFGDWAPSDIVFEDVWIEVQDSTRLHGWYLPHASPSAAVVFFHGNGEDVSWCGPEMSMWRDELGVSVLVMDYRGYGKSEGKPGEKQLVADGVVACKWLAQREQIHVSDIVLWGRSIGGGVAAGVAESTKPRAMVMECTFDSLTNVASHHMPWVPVRWLMSNKYPSSRRLKDYRGELIQWHGNADNIVPLDSAIKLHQAIPSTSKVLTIGNQLGHNDPSPDEFKVHVRDLFKRLTTRATEQQEN